MCLFALVILKGIIHVQENKTSMAYENHAGRVRKLAGAKNVRIVYWDHALKEMAKDSISMLSVLSMLRRCSVELVETRNFQERIRAVGRDVDGNKITTVVVLTEETITIEVVTAWR